MNETGRLRLRVVELEAEAASERRLARLWLTAFQSISRDFGKQAALIVEKNKEIESLINGKPRLKLTCVCCEAKATGLKIYEGNGAGYAYPACREHAKEGV
jgi:hypothetical protein